MRGTPISVIRRAVPGLKLTQNGTSRQPIPVRRSIEQLVGYPQQPGEGCEIVRSKVALTALIICLTGCASAPAPQTLADQPATETATPQMERFSLGETLAAGTAIAIDNPYGNVGLRFGGYEHQVELQAVRQQAEGIAPIAVEPAMVDGRWLLAPRLPQGQLLAEGQRLDVVVFIPEGHTVEVLTESGAVDARGVHDQLNIRSRSGDISVRGSHGPVNAETASGQIEIALGKAPAGSLQRLITKTGNIIVAVNDGLDATVALATSGVFATEYSLQVEHLQGQEPNKQAVTSVGTDAARVELLSNRGEIRLLRRADYTPAVAVGVEGKALNGEKKMNRAQAP